MKKIGIFAGTFDPIHEGHVAFAQAVLADLSLDKIYFLPERQPRRKTNVGKILGSLPPNRKQNRANQ
jgi:nicotinate-nucleotide adenylyltransferase